MAKWQFDRTAFQGGLFQLIIRKLIHPGRPMDVTKVRGTPTQFDSFTDADPFGDSTAQFTFPKITPFDDLDASDLAHWLGDYSDVDLYWVPTVPLAAQYGDLVVYPLVTNALTQKRDQVAPASILDSSGHPLSQNRIKVWEGFITSMDFSEEGLQVTCQGANFQLDRYLQKPFYPPQPWTLESLIQDAFNTPSRPPLRIQKLKTVYPTGWALKIPAYNKSQSSSRYTPVGKPGSLWSGYTSRDTGGWEHALTGFVQSQLEVMITDKRSGLVPGNQWTIQHVHQSASSPGRQPVLTVRDRHRTPDFSLRIGTPGVQVRMTRDTTQSENVIYGDGTGLDGTVWRNAVISSDGSRTDYLPLAASRDVYPRHNNPNLVAGAFVSEARTSFGPGFDQVDAVSSAEQALERDRVPGWTGTITLSVDPSEVLPRWLIRAGMTVLLKSFTGSGEVGLPLHITSTTKSPMQGTVELTVDSRYRDMLTVEEAQARTRDPLTPVKMLQVGKSSVIVQDLQAPWDYSAGSGFIPTPSKEFHASRPRDQLFPYITWAKAHPPLHYPSWYVKCPASSSSTLKRWTGPYAIPVLVSEADHIIRSEFYCVDIHGNPLAIPFHVSLYYINVTPDAMPHLNGSYSPFQDGAFESVNPSTGVRYNPNLAPANGFIIGWGNKSGGVLNRAGFWPGRETSGAKPTGLLVDDAGWDFSMDNWRQYFKAANPPGSRAKNTDISIYAMFYAEYKTSVYFQGRLFRQNPGTST